MQEGPGKKKKKPSDTGKRSTIGITLKMLAIKKMFCIVKNEQKTKETHLNLPKHILFVQVSFLMPKSLAS